MFKHTLSLVASATLVASLGADTLTVDPIVVTATKTEQSLQNTTANVKILTGEELEEKHITSVTEALNLASGISFTSNGGLGKSTSVYVRGFDSKRVLVLIDGIRYNDPTGTSGAPFEHLMITDIERIEIVKGAQSGIWGADASAGVINIITKSAQKGLHGTLNGEYGSFNTKQYGVSASYATDAYYFKASSNVVDTNGFTAQAPRGVDINTLEDDGYKNTTTSFKVGYKLNDTNKVDVTRTIIHGKGAYDGNSGSAIARANDATKKTSTYDTFSSLNFNHIDSFNEVNLYAKRSTFEREYTGNSHFDGNVNEYGITSKIPYRNKSDFVLVGTDYKTFEHLNAINKQTTNKALFVTNNNTFNDKTTLTESVRADYYDDFNDKKTGKIGIKHNLEKDLYVSSNYGTAYNVPTLANLYGAFGPNPNLTPESTRSFDVSIGYKGVILTYFYNTIDNMIAYTTKYVNITGTSTLKGFEAEYKKEVLAQTLFSLNYTKLSAKDKDGFELERRAKENLKAGIDYYGIEKFHFGVFGEYVGKRIQYAYGTHNISAQTGSYTIANAVINYDLSDSIQLYGKVDNITNKYYQTVDGYATSARAYYVGLQASF